MRIRDLSPLLILLSTELWSIDQPLVYAQSYSKDKHSKIIALKCESVNVEPTELQHQLERAIVGSFEVILGNLGFNLVPFSQSKRSEVFLLTKITNRFSNGSRSNGDFIISIDCELRESTTHKFEWKKSFQYTATALVGKSISVYAGSQLILHEKYYSSNFSYLSSLEDQEIMININNSNSYTLTKGEDVRKELAVSVLTEMVAEFRQDLIADLNLPVHSNQDNRDLEYRQIEAAIYKALQQKRWESHAYRRIGSIYGKDLTELDKAVHYYQRALNISVEIKNKYSQEIALYEIGNLYYRVREYSKAIEYFKKALNVAREVNYIYAIFDNLHYLGDSYSMIEQDSLALFYYTETLKLKEKNEELDKAKKERIATIHKSIGDLYRNHFDHQEALNSYYKALTIYREAGDEKNEASIYNKIGIVYLNRSTYGNAEIALSYFKKALETDGTIENNSYVQTYIRNIAATYEGLKKYAQAASYFRKLLEIEKELGNKEEQADILVDLGSVHESSGDYSQAKDCYTKALLIYQEIANSPKESSARAKLHSLKD